MLPGLCESNTERAVGIAVADQDCVSCEMILIVIRIADLK